MISRVEIQNFRGIKNADLTLKNNSILYGANKIGKSTVLTAINWLVTNTFLTDKWGVGENDQVSVMPKKADGSIDVEATPTVTITLDSGATFTKAYSYGTGNTYKVNGVKESSKKKFEEQLFNSLGFTKKLKCEKEVNELRLFTDPLYALQKLEAKALRTLLIELGCSVSNEEVFELKPNLKELEPYETKYFGDYTKMRTSLKADKLEQQKQVDAYSILLNDKQHLQAPNLEERKALEDKKQTIIKRINDLSNGETTLVSELQQKIKDLQNEKQVLILNFQNENNLKIGKLEANLEKAINDADKEKNERIKAINGKIQELSNTLLTLNASKTAYSNTRNNKRYEAQRYQEEYSRYEEELASNKVKLEQTLKLEFKGLVTCPDCGKVFAPNVEEEMLFNKHKQDEIKSLNEKISNLDIKLKQTEKFFNEVVKLGNEAKAEEEKVEAELSTLKKEIDDLNNEKAKVSDTPTDYSKVDKLKVELEKARSLQADTSVLDTKINEANASLRNAILESQEANAKAIEDARVQLADVEEQIKASYTQESDYKTLLEAREKVKAITSVLNDTEYLLELTNQFIQTKIKLINNKAKDITGLDFVMLEDNISNDGVKEVCYATVDGVDFGNVNTSDKIVIGIKFIERMKEILGSNNLPILADRLEGFDDLEKIKVLTNEQLICTVVGNKQDKNIVIL